MPGDVTGGTDPGPVLDGIAAVIIAVTGGLTAVAALLRRSQKNTPPPVVTKPDDDDALKRLAIGLLDMHERDLTSKDIDYARSVRRNHQLDRFIVEHGLVAPTWEDETDG